MLTQIDHTVRYADGGPTLVENLGLLCHRHHAIKDNSMWNVSQPVPGEFHFTSELGQQYRVREEHPWTEPAPEPEPEEEEPPF